VLYDVAFMMKAKYGLAVVAAQADGGLLPTLEKERLLTTLQVTADSERSALVQAVVKAHEVLAVHVDDLERVEVLVRPFVR